MLIPPMIKSNSTHIHCPLAACVRMLVNNRPMTNHVISFRYSKYHVRNLSILLLHLMFVFSFEPKFIFGKVFLCRVWQTLPIALHLIFVLLPFFIAPHSKCHFVSSCHDSSFPWTWATHLRWPLFTAHMIVDLTSGGHSGNMCIIARGYAIIPS